MFFLFIKICISFLFFLCLPSRAPTKMMNDHFVCGCLFDPLQISAILRNSVLNHEQLLGVVHEQEGNQGVHKVTYKLRPQHHHSAQGCEKYKNALACSVTALVWRLNAAIQRYGNAAIGSLEVEHQIEGEFHRIKVVAYTSFL